ncbi:SMC family protein [Fulvivirga sediminis]|uniref:Rad50/SbcC-type AAA domain-containing protein n=1 Tax=Fulvivirga sediminis TaxID=2803949 RepID=A0A937K0B0_9BACT|nr:hypothetical protein [Fulvivirga sediminis]MBL3655332.1 hypothetical protein [Fulvivirga sediminis]
MNNRIHIKELRVTGPGVSDASLVFERGLNVIDGASNTGKSYAIQCLDYMLGADRLPKQIDEAVGYTDIYLEIKLNENQPLTFKRDLRTSSDFTMAKVSIDEFPTRKDKITLKKKHEANNTDTFSGRLLQIIDLTGKKIKTNQRNSTRSLSFRDIARLISVDEVEVIDEKSPIYTGQVVSKTAEESVFSLLLTGTDASDLEEIEDKKIRRGRLNGQIALIEKFVAEYNDKLTALNVTDTKEEALRIEARIAELSSILSEISKEQEELTKKRKELWEKIENYKSRILMNSELQDRFHLLQTHYQSDLKRLEFVTTGEEMLNQLHTVECPVCGNALDKDHFDCNIQSEEGQEVRAAMEAEIEKIQIKMADLLGTIKNLDAEKQQLQQEQRVTELELKELSEIIARDLEPRKARTKQEVENLLQEQKNMVEVQSIEKRISDLAVEKSKLSEELQTKQIAVDDVTEINYTTHQEFSDYVAQNLKDWDFSPNPSVQFDPTTMDLIIDGKARVSNGKGFRGIAHTAFIIGLMNYCYGKSLPHPGTVIIDSPLTAYQKADYTEEDELSSDMESAFFEALSKTPPDRQIIVFDNKSPSDIVVRKINYIHFTKNSSQGRYGFIPID